jgi:small subunit ribosomal protein S23e
LIILSIDSMSYIVFFLLSYSKPSGLRAGRKLHNHRKNEKWSSKDYNKAHSVTHMKANPLGGSCMAKGIVVEKM